ncbi:hypothetical protein EDB85DRAFT_1887449 [Lactarius pseudohatsudake]|nr:hypothetical protein EDB85DRAFT_1887449 [Lactarius pseudohatsudake]
MNALLEAAGGGDSFEPLDDDPTLVPGSPGEDNGNEDLDEPEVTPRVTQSNKLSTCLGPALLPISDINATQAATSSHPISDIDTTLQLQVQSCPISSSFSIFSSSWVPSKTFKVDFKFSHHISGF